MGKDGVRLSLDCRIPMSVAIQEHKPLVDLSQIKHPAFRLANGLFGRWIRHWLRIDAVNELERNVAQLGTAESFFHTVLDLLGCRYEVSAADLMRIPASGPVVVVSNHPLGGLDGIVLGDLLRQRRTDVKLMANYLLKRVTYADAHMIFVDPFAKDSPAASNVGPLRQCLKHLKGGGLLGVFPGNQVSSYRRETGLVADPDWVPHIAALIRRTGATVVPLYIEAENGWFFERIGLIHGLLRTLLLTRVFMDRGRSRVPIPVAVGEPIPAVRLKRFEDDEGMIRYLRMSSYALKNRFLSKPVTAVPAAPNAGSSGTTDGSGFKPVAEPLSRERLEADMTALPADALLLSQGDSEVYIGRYEELPAIMQEIGRGREVSFRYAGGGTGEPLDLAEADRYYRHLFVWNKKEGAVVGAYRLGLVDEVMQHGGVDALVSCGLFEFKADFVEKIQHGLELGRSYVLPEFQRSYSSLLLLWGGILAFIARNPQYRTIFGAVGISQGAEYTAPSRALMVGFLRRVYGDEALRSIVRAKNPYHPVELDPVSRDDLTELVSEVDDLSTLIAGLEKDGKGVPILIKQYIRMNARLIEFGVWENHSNAVVALLLADLATADPRFLKRYMGDKGYQNFMTHHGLAGVPDRDRTCI
jgi:putative hemolysin